MNVLPKLFTACALAFVASPETLTAPKPSAAGIRNFHQVNDHVWRGAQPTDEGWKSLANLGVKTVIDLRQDGEDGEHSIERESRAVHAAGMSYVSIPLKRAPAGPTHDQIAKILGIFDSGGSVFVHCKEGKDRTGTAIACYRIAHDSWGNGKALDEAKSHGFHWYEIGMKAYIQSFRPDNLRAAMERATGAGAAAP